MGTQGPPGPKGEPGEPGGGFTVSVGFETPINFIYY